MFLCMYKNEQKTDVTGRFASTRTVLTAEMLLLIFAMVLTVRKKKTDRPTHTYTQTETEKTLAIVEILQVYLKIAEPICNVNTIMTG